MTDANPSHYAVETRTVQALIEVLQEAVGSSIRYAPLPLLSWKRAERLVEELQKLKPIGAR